MMFSNKGGRASASLPEAGRKAGRTRWWIVWTLFGSTSINYISRQTFSVLSPVIAAQYHLSHGDLAKIIGAFQLSYAFTWLVGGIFLDVVGTRIGLALAVIWWSAVNIAMGFCRSVAGFAAMRFMLGIGEGLNWPGASKTVAEWFPGEERSVAVAIFDSGSSVGGALAAIVIPWIAIRYGWRWSFIFSGVLGFLWLGVWLYVYHPLKKHPRVSAEERALIEAGNQRIAPAEGKDFWRWIYLLKDRKVWGIILGRALTDPIGWFYIFWLPQYLSDARGFSLKQIALFAWMPFVASDIGNFTGGFLSGYLVRRGMTVFRARLWVCVVSCIPILAGIPAARVDSSYSALALICFALWGFSSWSTMGLTLPSDLFPQEVVGTVTGFSGFAAGLASVFFTFMIGVTVDRFSYRPAFLVAGLLPLLATVCVKFLIQPGAATEPDALPGVRQ